MVGDRVVASSSVDTDRCLGPAESGRVGKVVEFNCSEQTYKVECDGNSDWYTRDQLVNKTTVFGNFH